MTRADEPLEIIEHCVQAPDCERCGFDKFQLREDDGTRFMVCQKCRFPRDPDPVLDVKPWLGEARQTIVRTHDTKQDAHVMYVEGTEETVCLEADRETLVDLYEQLKNELTRGRPDHTGGVASSD